MTRRFWGNAVLLIGPALLGGCGLPLPLVVASYAADAISLVETGKTVTDHVLSAAIDEDCRMWRVLKGEHICLDEAELAQSPDAADTDEPDAPGAPPATPAATVAVRPLPGSPAGGPAAQAAAAAPVVAQILPSPFDVPLPGAKPGAIGPAGAGAWAGDEGFDLVPVPMQKPAAEMAAFPRPVGRAVVAM